MKTFTKKVIAAIATFTLFLGANAATQLTLNNGDTLQGVYEDYEITIAAGATVTFNGASLTNTTSSSPAVKCLGNATIVLAEGSDNSVVNMANYYSAIYPAANATLTIQGAGSLYVAAPGTFFKNYGAAIGSYSSGSDNSGTPCGNIVISGGNITAVGGYCGAGVGACSYDAACGDITITGDAVVHATGGEWAAGIGAASDRSPCGDITISGNASVTATSTAYSDANSAGIGAGYDSTCGDITISTTGTVEAQGVLAAGIGAGGYFGAACAGITITSGIITATGGVDACAIGASFKAGCGDILIEGGTITATGGEDCPGVGALGETASITITGGNVTAIGGSNGSRKNGGAGIGSMYYRTCGNITISGGTVTATGGAWAAGIGSGYEGTCSNITISAGMVTANVCTSTGDGETDTVAIGAGCCGTCGNILISGGTVVANATNPQNASKDFNSAIGATYYNSKCGDITITDGITSVTATKGATAQQHIGQGNGDATIGTITYGSHLKQTLSNNDLTVTVEPNWVEIGNVTQLKAVANDLSGWYRLTADIDLANESWRLGTFTGVFDGNGHTISNINCNNDWDNSGFFFALGDGAVVRNLSLRGGKVTTWNGSIGGLAGRVSGNVLIEDCTIDVLVSSGGGGSAGGFVGYVSNATLTLRRCRSLSAVVCRYDRVGGFVGYPYGSAVITVEDCYAAGSVKGSSWVGGIVGCPDGGGNSLLTISNSYSVAELTGCFGSPDERVGGLNSRVVIIGKPTILDNFPTNIVNVRTRGTGVGTASYDAATGEFTATPNSGSAFYGWEGLPPEEGDYNERTVWAVFGKPVATASDFNNMDAGGIYVQTADIDLEGESGAIGYNGVFTGYYNGGNHEIRNMVKSGGYYSHGGLFSQMEGAVVKNLRIVDANVTGGDGTAALVGYAVKSTIENVRVEGGSVKGSGNNIGGLVGQASSGLFEECMSSATVEGKEALGGLVGHGGGSITVRRSYATGDVTGSRYAGGFIGNGDYINFTDCYALGAVTATNSGYYAGGFIAGGVGVYNAYFAFTNCYSAGAVSGAANSGGFDSSERYTQRGCTSCYWDTEASGKNSSYVSGVTGLTTAEMQSGVAFDGWDTTVWKFTQGQYPRLRAFIPKYTVTWLNEDGETVLGESVIDEGDTPVYDGETLTKEGDAQYTYMFAGWTPAVEAIVSNTTYTAKFLELEIKKDGDGNYLVDSVHDWLDFAQLVEVVPTANARMTADIALGDDQTMIGTDAVPYQGTFDGQGKTLTVNYSSYDATIAPFRYVGAATIRNLHVDGSIATYSCAAGGIAGAIRGSLTVSNCWVSASISATNEGSEQGTIGGIASYCVTDDCSILIADCLFTGAITNNTYYCGGFMSHIAANNIYVTMQNCLNAGTFPAEAYSCGTFIRDVGETWTLENCYYKTAFGEVQGAQATAAEIVNGTTATALQGERGEVVWVQDAQSVQPILVTFFEAIIVWQDDGGKTLETDEYVAYGATPSYDGDEPMKAADAQYTYTFKGWSPALATVVSNTTYTAAYSQTVNKYTITFKNHDGSTLQSGPVDYGTTPAYSGETPTKPDDTYNTYTFDGWNPAVVAVTGNQTYTAQFSQHSKWTGSGTSAEPYTLATPARISEIIDLYGESVPDEIYVRTGGDVTAESISAQLPAGYAVRTTATPGVVKVVQTVTVVWYDEDGETVLERDEDVDIGSMPSFDGARPTKAATAQYTYEFNGWTPTVVAVTESASYTATYTETLRSYTITWLDADGSQIETSTVAYGGTPSHAAPASVYTFNGWTPAIATVTGDATYTATYSNEVVLNDLAGDYTAADGDVLTGTTAHNVTIPGGATVTINGVSVTGAGGGGAAPEAPSFSEDAETAVARIEKGADGKWTIVAFAELATGTAAGVDGMVKILRGDEPNAVVTPVTPESLCTTNAVKVEAVVVPPVGKDKQFFKVEYGSK